MITPVILCGGSGTRLWPLSRKSYPKQFSTLLGSESPFIGTCRRLSGEGFDAPLVMTNADFRFLVTDQLSQLGLADARILIEPASRNTGPAILTAALSLKEQPDALMLIAPSDHLIGDEAAFIEAIRKGAEAARAGQLVTFGITPDRAETGYGYLELAGDAHAGTAQPVAKFVEKPDQATAEAMLASGRHLWNAGIFLFRVADILAAFEAHAPDLLPPCQASIETGATDLDFFRLGEDAYGGARDISIDYAVMEHSQNISAVPYGGGWSDLGAWDAILDALETDGNGTATTGTATALDCENTLLRSEDKAIELVGLGLKNTVAVAMRDAVLVADINEAQRVKEVVSLLKAKNVPQAVDFPRFHRPWGWYETLCIDTRFQVKRIMVKPGGILSLQSHMHRSEHWVVVAGTARVTIGEEVKLLSENQSVYIPLGEVHRMENPGKVPMYLIEVQTGTYLGEDDIIRYEDAYART